jgi:hypothetical protein
MKQEIFIQSLFLCPHLGPLTAGPLRLFSIRLVESKQGI